MMILLEEDDVANLRIILSNYIGGRVCVANALEYSLNISRLQDLDAY
jgi:hypothetical protein